MDRLQGRMNIRRYCLKSIMLVAVTGAVLGGSCLPTTETALCQGTNLRCPSGFICSDDQRTCIQNRCGDREKGIDEECDDGNLVDGDDCDSNCTFPGCGNGVIKKDADGNDEECDDGNLVDGDLCDSDCTTTKCGNGIKTPGEECDYGAANSNNGECLLNCRRATCGDGHMWMEGPNAEQCDDGSMNSDSGVCLTDCRLAVCGDGHVQEGAEECDDGNDNDCGTCKTSCRAFWERAKGTIEVIQASSIREGEVVLLTDNSLLQVTFLYVFIPPAIPLPPNMVPILLMPEHDAVEVAEATKNAINEYGPLRITASLREGSETIVDVIQDQPGKSGNETITKNVSDGQFKVTGMLGGTGTGCMGGLGCKTNADCMSRVCLPTKLCQ